MGLPVLTRPVVAQASALTPELSTPPQSFDNRGRFELESLTEYTDDAVLEEIRRLAQTHSDGPFTLAAFKRLSPRVSANTIQRRFGNWKGALQKAGLEHLSPERFLTPYQERLNRGGKMSDDELISEMQRVHHLTGRDVLTSKDFNRLSVTCYEPSGSGLAAGTMRWTEPESGSQTPGSGTRTKSASRT